jgi:hypothetical protein
MRESNDEDWVPLPYPKRNTEKQPPKPKPIPDDWIPMTLPDGIPENGRPNLPENVDRTKPVELFKLIFDDYIVGKLTRFTNRNYRINGLRQDQEKGKTPMKLVTECEMWAYIGIQMYAGAEAVKDFISLWNTDENSATHKMVRRAMSKHRYYAINKWFCLYSVTAQLRRGKLQA